MNPQPSVLETDALPIELLAYSIDNLLFFVDYLQLLKRQNMYSFSIRLLASYLVNSMLTFIFAEFFDKVRYGYASALAFVLFAVILSLTFINNRLQGSRVFYG